ncbi:MAG: MBL fold metallo-hydrolase [Saprospiraceae bacterium]
MRVKFCGAAQEVTGSSHLLTLDNGYRILLDCGLYQGPEPDEADHPLTGFNEKWLFNPAKIDCLILSHSHIDHCGRVPRLVKDGFEGLIYCTHAARDLCALMLTDSAKIQEADAAYHNKHVAAKEKREPYYTMADAHKAMQQFVSVSYDRWFHVGPGVRVMFRDAGHILGSASVNLEITEGDRVIRFGFTGDIGRPDRPILRDPISMLPADYLICESTYGDREHEPNSEELDELLQIVRHTCVEKKGKLIIPAFSVGRTQEVVYLLDQLHHQGLLPKVPVFVDSPLAVNATEIFMSHPECFDEETQQYMLENEDPFGFNDLQYIRSKEASQQINEIKGPAIIISASGMMNAGRIQHHLLHNIENPRNTFLIIGYCAPNTPGGQLRRGDRHVHVLGQNKQVIADVRVMDSFSAHGDRREMLDFLSNQRATARKIWLTHGTPERQEKWREYLLDKGFQEVAIPGLGDEERIE